MSDIQLAAARLRQAAETRQPCSPVRDLLPPDDVAAAYAVQQALRDADVAAGRDVVGWKIGLTSPTVQQQLGVDQPDSGALFADMQIPDQGIAALNRLLQPRVEAEVAFVLGRDLDRSGITVDDVVAAVEFVVPSLEIVDSRIAGWDITIVDTIADNASSGLFVLGEQRTTLEEIADLADIEMQLWQDGVIVSHGTGAACLGNPLAAVVWLANALASTGNALRAGDIVLSGALGPMVDITGPCHAVAELSGLGSVSVEFSLTGHAAEQHVATDAAATNTVGGEGEEDR